MTELPLKDGWLVPLLYTRKVSYTGILSPEADTSFDPNDTALYSVEKAAATLSWVSEMDDPESNIISTLHSPTIPHVVAAFGLTVATTTLILWGFSCSWDASAPSETSLVHFPMGTALQYGQIDHKYNTFYLTDIFVVCGQAADTCNTLHLLVALGF